MRHLSVHFLLLLAFTYSIIPSVCSTMQAQLWRSLSLSECVCHPHFTLLLGWKCWKQSWGSSHTSTEDVEVNGKARKQRWEQNSCGSCQGEGYQVIWVGGVHWNTILAILWLKISQEKGISQILHRCNCMLSRKAVKQKGKFCADYWQRCCLVLRSS